MSKKRGADEAFVSNETIQPGLESGEVQPLVQEEKPKFSFKVSITKKNHKK